VRSSLSSKLTYANVMSTIAVVLAVGGGATALALTLPKNSVHSKQIAKGAVKTSDIGKDAVTGDKVKESTLGKVPLAAHADTADSAATAANATNAAHAAVADSLGSLTQSNTVQTQSAVTGAFNDELEVNVKGFGRFWLRCHQNTASLTDDTVSFNLSTIDSVRANAIETGFLAANEFPDSAEPFLIANLTTDGASSEYGTQGRRLAVHYTLGIIGGTKTLQIDGGGFDDSETPGCAGQLHASVSG
jgi:hypothetical protein